MRRSGALEVLFALFLGILLTGVVYATMITINPAPAHGDLGYYDWPIFASTFMVVAATLVMIVSLTIPDRVRVLANGALFGGLYAMLIGIAYTLLSERAVPRLVLMLAALAVTVVVGYVRFTKRAKQGHEADADLAGRVDTLERRMQALGDALR